jgi:hypothetical protein
MVPLYQMEQSAHRIPKRGKCPLLGLYQNFVLVCYVQRGHFVILHLGETPTYTELSVFTISNVIYFCYEHIRRNFLSSQARTW